MTGKEYLEIRKRQDELLSVIDDLTPDDDSKIIELLSLQKECDDFERKNVHQGYSEMNLTLEVKTVVRIIREAHEAGMNASDFVSMVLAEYMDAADEVTWTTNLIDTEDYNGNEYPVNIPEEVMKRRGWKVGDFVRVTVKEDLLTVQNLHID